jgi:long-chain acyl-CoA synthetase
MEQPWLKHYPQGVPHDVDLREFESLVDVFDSSCAAYGPLPAFSNRGTVISYAELDALSRDFAAWLQQSLGLRRGDAVALMMPNLLQVPVALFGVLRAGLVVVNVNPQYTAPELRHQLKDSGAVAIVVLENFAHTVQDALQQDPTLKLAVVTSEVGDLFPLLKEVFTNVAVKYVKHLVPPFTLDGATGFNTALRAGHGLRLDPVRLRRDDLAFLQYTGGTTGVAKGAMLSHGNLVANLQQLSAWIAPALSPGREILVCPLPLYHVYALSSALMFMKIGAHTVLVTDPRNMPALLHDLKQYPFTALIGVNTLYRALLDAPGFVDVDTRCLKLANAGGMAVQRVVAERWKKATGVPLIEAYGLTETSPGVSANRLDISDWTGTIGLPLPSTQVRILDDLDHDLPAGETGEICVRGPQVMQGYWKRPDETARVFTVDGWLRTGDIGRFDDQGRLSITDRKKDLIVVSGFKVFPNQVEDAVALHPGVAEVGAVGVPDERSGEAVKIVVVRRDPALTAQDLLAHCRLHLTGYKMPTVVAFSTEPLPKSNLGKILRRALRDGPPAAPVLTPPVPALRA